MAQKALWTTLIILFLGAKLSADDRVLFNFVAPESSKEWNPVNDGVMGGVSEGRFQMTGDKTMEFYGTLSLANNGGFASVRSRRKKLQLEKGDAILARLRGDGREYTLNLYVPRSLTAFSYRATFKTTADEWIEVRIPLDKFVATSFGRIVPNAQPLNPGEVDSLGFLLSDKKAGPFKLEVDWIKVRNAEPSK